MDKSVEELTSYITENQDKLVRILSKYTDDFGEIEDILQETVLRGILQIRQREKIKNIPAWVVRVSQNIAIDNVRRRTKHREVHLFDEADRAPEPEKVVLLDEQIKRLTDLFSYLTDKQLEVLRLHYIDGLKNKDIAKQMGVSHVSVRQFHMRAMAKLRELFFGYGQIG